MRLNTCIAADGKAARDALRPTVARLLGAARLKFQTAQARGLALPPEAVASVAGAPYASGFTPYLPLLPMITDRHMDAFTLAGTVEEVAEHVIALRRAGADSVIVMPICCVRQLRSRQRGVKRRVHFCGLCFSGSVFARVRPVRRGLEAIVRHKWATGVRKFRGKPVVLQSDLGLSARRRVSSPAGPI